MAKKEIEIKNTSTDVAEAVVLPRRKVLVRYIPKTGYRITNPKHVFAGGMAENSVRAYTVPITASGNLCKVLTDEEQAEIESAMGYDPGTLSPFRKKDNYWENYFVKLKKQDTKLDLSIPEDFIKYKVLLANTEFIAPSMKEMEDRPKATYKYVIINKDEEVSRDKVQMTNIMKAYKIFGKYEDRPEILRVILESITNRKVEVKTKIEFLHTQLNTIIQNNTKLFIKVAEDPFLEAKATLRMAHDKGLVSYRGGNYFLKETNMPLCNDKEESTLNNAARFISEPKNQELLFELQAKIKE